ncbi:MAG: hypothetical protein KGZ74_18510 [Chitinophagaceae bacterium]|nr:hypothetical protein [Chitinophagaceae bacterium]
MNRTLLLSLIAIILITSCARRRTMERVQGYGIRTIAILPIDLTVAGSKPVKISAEEYQNRIERNRKYMYNALYIDLVQFGDMRLRKYSNVEFQSIDKTRDVLKEKNISDSAAQEMDGEGLAKLLGVDAVIKTKITQNRIMSDEAALGVDVVSGVIRSAGIGVPLPTGAARTSDIYVSCSLLKRGYAVWSTRFNNSTDWNYPVEVAMQDVTRGIARRFPL